MLLKLRSLYFLPVFFMALVLSACGFQLRGESNLPPALQTLVLSFEGHSQDFNRDVRIALAQAGIETLEDQPNTDFYELKINPLSTQDTVMARASDNDITQVQREIRVTYFIRDTSGKALWGPRTISSSIMLNNQDAEQSVKAAYNAEQIQRISRQLARELVYDLNYASL